MYCEQCGKHNEDGKKYCYSCGSPLMPENSKKQGTVGAGKTEKSIRSLAGAQKTPSFYVKEQDSVTEGAAEKKTAKAAGKKAENKKAKNAENIKMIPAEGRKEKKDEAAVGTQKKTEGKQGTDLEAMEKELRQLNKKKSPAAALIVALLVFAATASVLAVRIPKLYGPAAEAAGYETAVLSGKWEDAYSCLNLAQETSEFLSKEMFEKVMKRSGASGFRNLTLEEVGSEEDRKVFAATYDTAEGSHTDYVTLCATGEKKLLFLKEWKVDPSTVTVSNVTVAVPQEAELKLNGLEPEGEGLLNQEEHTKEYTFERLFAGIWEAELQAENRAVYCQDLEITGDCENQVVSMAAAELYPDQTVMDGILNQFVQDYSAILEASVNRADFSEVEQYFASQAIEEGRAQNLYANACSQAYDPERGSGIIRYELSDITAQFVPILKSGYAREGDIVMEIHSVMSYSYVDNGVEKNNTQASVGLLCYHQEDGQWKIQSFS
ncbi:MAG: zinc ribbon domain-containing protein [Lachnospiraceae bacterium]|nr:zinc ribbon domain-containing protein [Lachnospiraceae bacterium]